MKLPKTISASIDKIAQSAIGKDWNLYATLIQHWAEIVGPDYARQTAPVKIVFPHGKKAGESWAGGQRTDGTLSISLPQGLSMEFSHTSEQIRGRINSFFGYEAIGKIVLKPFYQTRQIPLKADKPTLSEQEKNELNEALKDIENNELRESLFQLGTSVIANQKKV